MIKAIETIYNGYKFRSRLEARWAVFFDALGIEWQYEIEGFDLDGIWYLPDFWFPEEKWWIEIKPTKKAAYDEELKICTFSNVINIDRGWDERCRVYVIAGEPYLNKYNILVGDEDHLCDGFRLGWVNCPLCDKISISHYNLNYGHYTNFTTGSVYCWNCDGINRNWKETENTWFWKGDVETKLKDYIVASPRLSSAYLAARQARFEHGKNGHN